MLREQPLRGLAAKIGGTDIPLRYSPLTNTNGMDGLFQIRLGDQIIQFGIPYNLLGDTS